MQVELSQVFFHPRFGGWDGEEREAVSEQEGTDWTGLEETWVPGPLGPDPGHMAAPV